MGNGKLRELRKAAGFTSVWGLAAKAGVSGGTISNAERYDYRPGPKVRARIADALGVPESEIWPEKTLASAS